MPRTWTKGSAEWPRHSAGERDVIPDDEGDEVLVATASPDAVAAAGADASPVDDVDDDD